MPGRLAGKVCVITGTGGSMGRAAALTFASEGALLVGCDVAVEPAEDTLQEVRAAGGQMVSRQPSSLGDPAECAKLVELAVSEFGRIDVLYNLAARSHFHRLEGFTDKEWRAAQLDEIDLVFYLTRAAWPYLKASRGVVVNMASLNGSLSFKLLPSLAHTTNKAAIIGVTRQLALEGSEHGIRVNSVSPSLIESNATRGELEDEEWGRQMLSRTLLGRFGKPEDVANVALFLASDESAYGTRAPAASPASQASGASRSVRVLVPGAFATLAAFLANGLFAGLSGLFLATTLYHPSHALSGATLFLVFSAGVVSQLVTNGLPAARVFVLGTISMLTGLAVLVTAVRLSTPSLTLFLVGGALIGAGAGAVFKGTTGLVLEATAPENQLAMTSNLLIALFVGLSIPVIGAGVALDRGASAPDTVLGFAILVGLGVAGAGALLGHALRSAHQLEKGT